MRRTRALPRLASVPLICGLALASSPPTQAQVIFSDGFESGDTNAWSSVYPRSFAGVADPSFEAGPYGGFWTEASTNFGTPICDITCGTGGGTGPRTGTYWAWLGGADNEVSIVSQTVSLPNGSSAHLRFHLELPDCDSEAGIRDVFEVRVNGILVYDTDNNDPACDLTGYLQRTVDISAFLGTTLTLEFRGECDSSNLTNFFLDDITIDHVP